jgi:L-threonylcarbamoyladenylate synthase
VSAPRATPAPRVARWRAGGDVATLADALDRGGLVAIPTESSYGLAVDPRSEAAVAALLRLKGEREGKPLPVVCGAETALGALGVDRADPALAWARPRWPAALSVVVALAAPVAASLGRSDLAVRIPGHEGLKALLGALGRAVTATSANPSGAPPYLDPDELAAWLEREAFAAGFAAAIVVDGGRLAGGAPSTLVRIEAGRPVVLRSGRFRLD